MSDKQGLDGINMKIRFGILLSLLATCVTPAMAANDDPFDFDNFAIADSGDADINVESVSINTGASPAAVESFDIAGIMLGMPFEDVQTLFFKDKGLYSPRKKDSIVYTIAKDWKFNLDYECRRQGIVIPAELSKCVNSLARNRGLLYASELHLERENTGEKIVVYFTSNATDNLVWRIVYNNDANDLEGADEKFENQRQKKILAFWQNVLDKYGAPNSGTDKWVSTTNAYDPMMTAYYGALDLVDNGRYASDAAKNVQDARNNFQAKPYAF